MKDESQLRETNVPRYLSSRGSLWYVILFIVGWGLVGCASTQQIEGEGTITLPKAQEGIYTLTAEDGEVYHPLNLAPRFIADSLEVHFEGATRPEAQVAGMEGVPIEVRAMIPKRFHGEAQIVSMGTTDTQYGIETDGGFRFQPAKALHDRFRVDSLPVTVLVTTSREALRQRGGWGTLASIDSVAYADTMVASGTGRIVYKNLEGGFFGIEELNGSRFLPVRKRIPDEFREDGTQVHFVYRVSPSTITTAMWGTPVELIKMWPFKQ